MTEVIETKLLNPSKKYLETITKRELIKKYRFSKYQSLQFIKMHYITFFDSAARSS